MNKYDLNYRLIETEEQMERFYQQSKDARWLAFDTEFIPEKYYRYKLCLISAATSKGNYIIDVLKLKSIEPFLKLIQRASILKITHAGENDYQLLMDNYGILPSNVFDTQLSHGFLHYEYPLGLQTMVKKVLKKRIDKGQLRSDWERRPLTEEQCRYAIGDVVYLHAMTTKIRNRLKKNKKLLWAEEENRRLEAPEYYQSDPLDFLNGGQVHQLTRQQKVFLLRMHLWRHLEAEKENRPVTQVLKTWVLNTIVQKIGSDDSALLKDRTLPSRFLRQNINTFKRLYRDKISPHEQELLQRIPEASSISPQIELLTDIFHQVIKYKGLTHKVSPKIIIPGKELQRMKADRNYFPTSLSQGWRQELLGKDFGKLLAKRDVFDISIKKNRFILTLKKSNRFSLKRFFSWSGHTSNEEDL